MITTKQKIQVFLGIKKLGCKWCLLLWKKDVAFRSQKKLFKHLEEVHGIKRIDENIINKPRFKLTWWKRIMDLYHRLRIGKKRA